MSKTPSITEQELQGLSPCGLDKAFLSRLAACAGETFTTLSDEEIELEGMLRSIRPRTIRSGLKEDLRATIGDAPFSVDGTIVLFNKSNQASPASSKPRTISNIFRFNIAAAAAVALLGSIAALMVPNNAATADPVVSAAPDIERIVPLAPVPSNFAPAGNNRTLSETIDEGVIWKNETQPLRVLRHTFSDRFTTEGENGETIQEDQPHTEYSLIPEKVD